MLAAEFGELADVGSIARSNLADARQMRMVDIESLTKRTERIVGQLVSERIGQRAQNGPVLARIARRKCRTVRHLYAAFGVHISHGFFRISGSRQNHVSPVRPAIAM